MRAGLGVRLGFVFSLSGIFGITGGTGGMIGFGFNGMIGDMGLSGANVEIGLALTGLPGDALLIGDGLLMGEPLLNDANELMFDLNGEYLEMFDLDGDLM